MTAPGYLPVLVLGMSIFMTAATLSGLNRALVRASWPDGRRAWVLRAAAVLLIGWFAVALALALVGAFEGVPGRPPTIQYGFLVPVASAGNSPLQVAAFDSPNALIDIYPLVLIPVFLVPLWTILHIVSLIKLRRAVAAYPRTLAAGRSA